MAEKKGFIGKLLDKLDGKIEEKSKEEGCGCKQEEKKKGCCG